MTESPRASVDLPRRALPARPSLEKQKKLAKALLRDAKAGVEEAKARLVAFHPDPADLQDRPLRLADAQIALAREYGLASWPKLRTHVLELQRMANEIDDGAPSPDRDVETLHIRCGSDIRQGLVEAGFGGEFLEFADPLCRGPLIDAPLPDYLAMRARWIAETWDGSVEQTLDRLTEEYEGLAKAADRERVVLWFEHDPYDQLILARVLAEMSEWPRRVSTHSGSTRAEGPRVELIVLDDYPGVGRFVGLGQLPPPSLRSLWERRRPVTHEMIELGRRTWAALTAPDPRALMEVIESGTPSLPTMGPALERHLAELPGVTDGLSLLERLTLQALEDGAVRGGPLFGRVLRLDPLPFMGDTMMAEILGTLAGGDRPAVVRVQPTEDDQGVEAPWHKVDWELTPFGRQLLQGSADWLSTAPPQRWVGGIGINSARPWRWDLEARKVTQS